MDPDSGRLQVDDGSHRRMPGLAAKDRGNHSASKVDDRHPALLQLKLNACAAKEYQAAMHVVSIRAA